MYTGISFYSMHIGKKPWQASGISKSILHRWSWWGIYLHNVYIYVYICNAHMLWYHDTNPPLGQLLEYNWFPCLSIGWFANARGLFEFYNYQVFPLLAFIWWSDKFVQLVGTTLRIWKSFCATYSWWWYKRLHGWKWKVSSSPVLSQCCYCYTYVFFLVQFN